MYLKKTQVKQLRGAAATAAAQQPQEAMVIVRTPAPQQAPKVFTIVRT